MKDLAQMTSKGVQDIKDAIASMLKPFSESPEANKAVQTIEQESKIDLPKIDFDKFDVDLPDIKFPDDLDSLLPSFDDIEIPEV